jgi:hypothetical protein
MFEKSYKNLKVDYNMPICCFQLTLLSLEKQTKQSFPHPPLLTPKFYFYFENMDFSDVHK